MKTRKRQSRKYNVYRTGNLFICVRKPIGNRLISKKYGGAESENEYLQNQIFQNLVAILPQKKEDQELKTYIESHKTSSDKKQLLDFIFSKKSNLYYVSLFNAINRRSLNMRDITTAKSPENPSHEKPSPEIPSPANLLYELLMNKFTAKTKIESIKNELNSVPDLDEKTKLSIINTLENGSGMSLSSLSSGAMNSLRKGSILLGNFLAPDPTKKGNRSNKTNIEILFYDRDNLHYKKGDSAPAVKDEEKRFGDFMVVTKPTQYADTGEYFSEMYGSVEDLLANIATPGENLLCMGDSEKCKKFSVKPKPYFKKLIRVVNNQPQIED